MGLRGAVPRGAGLGEGSDPMGAAATRTPRRATPAADTPPPPPHTHTKPKQRSTTRARRSTTGPSRATICRRATPTSSRTRGRVSVGVEEGGKVNVLSARGWWRGWGGRDSAIEGEVQTSVLGGSPSEKSAWTTSVLGGSPSKKLAWTTLVLGSSASEKSAWTTLVLGGSAPEKSAHTTWVLGGSAFLK